MKRQFKIGDKVKIPTVPESIDGFKLENTSIYCFARDKNQDFAYVTGVTGDHITLGITERSYDSSFHARDLELYPVEFTKGMKIKIPTAPSWLGHEGDDRQSAREAKKAGQDFLYIIDNRPDMDTVTVSVKDGGTPQNVFYKKDIEPYEENNKTMTKFKLGDKVKVPQSKGRSTSYTYEEWLREFNNNPTDHLVVIGVHDTHIDIDRPAGVGKRMMAVSFLERDLELFEEKKIVGYKAPKQLYGGAVPAGTLFKRTNSTASKTPMYIAVNDKQEIIALNYELPKELVEDWEAVYEEEPLKEGDWAIATGDADSRRTGNFTYAFKISRVERGFIYHSNTSSNRYIKHFRKATLEEIKEAEEMESLRFGDYPMSFIGNKKVNWGCQEFTREQVLFLYKFVEGAGADITISNKKLTREIFRNILKKMDEKK